MRVKGYIGPVSIACARSKDRVCRTGQRSILSVESVQEQLDAVI